MVLARKQTREELLKKREELRKRLQAIKDDYARGLDADFEEQAVQLENTEVLDGIAKATTGELEWIERQLKQLARISHQAAPKNEK